MINCIYRMGRRLLHVVVYLSFWSICLSSGQSGNRLSMTLLDRGPLQSESNDSFNNQYQCYVSDRDGTEDVDSYRLGYSRDGGEANNRDPPDAVDDTDNIYPRWLVDLDVTNNNAFGVFACNASRNGELVTQVSTVRMRSDGEIRPTNSLYTQTVNVGDEGVKIEMQYSGENGDLRWIKDDEYVMSANGMRNFSFSQPISLTDVGIYECLIDGERNNAQHGIKLLFVRGCPANRWGAPDCFGICDNCYNGGVCDEINGECICPPGFKGSNCETGCGFNRFGEACEFRFSSKDDNEDRCRGNLYCRPHPFGCTCVSGFRGLDCQDECSPGFYGASCLQICHCASGGMCKRDSGICTAGCVTGWSGSNCQVPDTCPDDYYGINCTEKCHCKDAAACDKMSGACSNGTCEPGYKVYDNDYCEECHGSTFGQDCTEDCHCAENSCNKITGSCSGECGDQWVDLFSPNNCQTGFAKAEFTKVNPGVAVPVHCSTVQGPGIFLTIDVFLSKDDMFLNHTTISLYNSSASSNNKMVYTFLVDNAIVGEKLQCQMKQGEEIKAFLEVTITDFYELPELPNAPTEVSSNGSSVEIKWTAWNEDDVGDGPIIGYIPYYRKLSGDCILGSTIPVPDTNFIFTGLDSETIYLFSVAVVRPGLRGEGQKSPEVQVTTICDVPKVAPVNITTRVAGQSQKIVNISWMVPRDEISCSSGVISLYIYYMSTNLEQEDKGREFIAEPSRTFFTLSGLPIGGNYSIQMTLETSGGESEKSDEIYHYVPILPTLHGPLTTRNVMCDALDVGWDTWDESKDPGTPPILAYITYYKMSSAESWIRGEDVPHDHRKKSHSYSFRNLTENQNYDFGIAVARKGYGGEGSRREVEATMMCPKTDKLIVVIVSISIGTVVLVTIAVMLLFRMRKKTSRKSEDPGSPAATICHGNVTGKNNGAFAEYENAEKSLEDAPEYEKCSLQEENKSNDEYEVPSFSKANAKTNVNHYEASVNEGIEFLDEESVKYQNTANEKPLDGRLAKNSSKSSIFMKSVMPEQKALSDLKLLETLNPCPDTTTLSGASKLNFRKNRFADIIPLDRSRPLLKSMCLTGGGNDYINASIVIIPSVTQTLIMAQAPLRNTTEDFWRLVFDYQCQSIIMLNDTFSDDQETAIKYWPEFDDIIFGAMKISTTSIDKKENYIIHKCDVGHQSFKESLKVDRFVFRKWPKEEDDLSPLVDFMNVVRFGSNKHGKVLVHCINGADRSGVYAAVCSEINKSDANETVNVFEAIKNIRLSNPFAVKHKEDYLLCHQLLNCYLTQHQNYDVIA